MQNPPDMALFSQKLKSAGLRTTIVRKHIFTCLSNSPDPMTIQQLISAVNDIHFVSVYRSLDTLTNIGVLKRVPIGLKYKYELSDEFKEHHHHVTCEECGMSVSVTNDEVEKLMMQLTKATGMRPTRHTIEAYGVCGRH